MSPADEVVGATLELRAELAAAVFPSPADFVYRPLDYAWDRHEAYLRRHAAAGPREILFLGMNPGPFGMAQTGVPFGEVAAVRDWLGLDGPVGRPEREHPGKPVEGFACGRSEVSGRRLWDFFRNKFVAPEAFFARHLVHNYCPLLFLEATKLGRNVVPEELPSEAMQPVNVACDRLLRRMVCALEVRTVVGVGGYAEDRAREALAGMEVKFARVPHPSPANPAANRGWSQAAEAALKTQGGLGLMGLLGEALSRPGVRGALWRAWYPFFSRRIAGRGVDFLNYAFDPLDGVRPSLDDQDEAWRHNVQLYAHVAGSAALRGRRVLEVSCGHGGGASWIVRTFSPEAYVGLDLNPEAVRHCGSRHRLPGLSFVQGDAQHLPFADASFDVVLNVEASHCYPDFPGFVDQVARVLKSGGLFLHADLRHAGGLPEWVGTLSRHPRLRLEAMRLITPEVLRGMEAVSDRHAALVRECLPWPLKGLGRDFAGVRGSLTHRALAAGDLDYRSFRLVRC